MVITTIAAVTTAESRRHRRQYTLRKAATKWRAPEPETASMVPAAGGEVHRRVRRPARFDDKHAADVAQRLTIDLTIERAETAYNKAYF